MKRSINLLLQALCASLLLCACGGGGDDASLYACAYEKRSSQTCNHYDWGAWVAGCTGFNADDYHITAQQVCSNLTQGGTHCASSCCIDSQYRNVALREGSCR